MSTASGIPNIGIWAVLSPTWAMSSVSSPFNSANVSTPTPRMVALRASFVEIDKIPLDDPGRVKFDRLHNWSEKLEGCVLLMGLAVVYAVARQFSD